MATNIPDDKLFQFSQRVVYQTVIITGNCQSLSTLVNLSSMCNDDNFVWQEPLVELEEKPHSNLLDLGMKHS